MEAESTAAEREAEQDYEDFGKEIGSMFVFVGLQRKVPIVLRETAAMLTHRHVANRAGHDIPQRMAGQTS